MVKKLKVVHLTYSGIAGSPHYAIQLSIKMKKWFDSSLLFFGRQALSDEYVKLCADNSIDRAFAPFHIKYDLVVFWRIFYKLSKFKPDLIVIHGTGNLLFFIPYLLAHPRAKFIVIEHGPGYYLNGFIAGSVARLCNVLSFPVVFVSSDVKKYWHDKFKRFPKTHKVIPNGVNVDEFVNMRHVKKSVPVLSMVAVFASQKDHVTLLQSIEELKKRGVNVKLILAGGDGPERKKVQALVKQLNLSESVEVRYNLTRKQILEIYEASDFYVHATRGEGLSMSILEAMAARLPVVTTAVSGNLNLIRDGYNGLLVPESNFAELANAIQRILKDEQLAFLLANNAYSNVLENYSFEKAVDKYVQVMCSQFR